MALKWTPTTARASYPVIYSPYSQFSGFPSFDTAAEAANYITENFANMISIGYGDPIRVSAANVIPGNIVGPNGTTYPSLTIYLPDYGGFWSQFPYSETYITYACTLFTNVIPEGAEVYFVVYQAPEESSPPPPPSDVTIQLKRDNSIGKYSVKPEDAAVLAKYYNPVKVIRANFDTTRVAVIEETISGGFMIYEEVASAAVSPVYVYTSKRRLQEIITANLIPQYRATI